MEYMAYRVLSLDETCRELNRKYILPIGYERNNMFLTDWSEEEFAELDFYDMFDLFYQENHTANGEFTFGNAMGTSAVYLISKEKSRSKKNTLLTSLLTLYGNTEQSIDRIKNISPSTNREGLKKQNIRNIRIRKLLDM